MQDDEELGIKKVPPGEEATDIAARLKLKYKNTLSLADCYLIAEADSINSKILTTDKAVKGVAGGRSIYFEIE